MLKVFTKAIKDLLPTNDPKEKAIRAEKKRKKEICERQKKLQGKEVVQEWRIAMGSEIPKKMKDTFVIQNITRRNVWMEEEYVFNLIKAHFPDEVFHPIEKYALRWQPPGSYFQVIVPLNDPTLQENAVLMINKVPAPLRKDILFLFAPVDPAMNMFAEKVHPASLVSYRTKNEVLGKLSSYYLEGRISLEELQQILTCDYDTWKSALFNYLPADEQVFHTYLNDKPAIEELGKPLHKSYYDGDITLEQYENMKYPDRKKQKDIESMEYPAPFEGSDCIICGEEKAGAIKCYTCDNMVCVDCVKDVFHPRKYSKGQSFLLMHHKYCMKLGELPEVTHEPIPEEAYLRQFRTETRAVALKNFIPEFVPTVDDISPLEEILDEEELRKQRLREEAERIRQEAERQRLAIENPIRLQELQQLVMERRKKYEKTYLKDLHDYFDKIADKSHTEQFILRNIRLKNELLKKLKKNVLHHLQQMEDMGKGMDDIPGPFYPKVMQEILEFKEEVEKMIETGQAIGEEEVEKAEQQQREEELKEKEERNKKKKG